MELLLLLAVATFGATASAIGLARGGRAGRRGAVLGGLSLLGVVAVSFALTAPRVGAGEIPPGVGILDGRLIPNDYMRLVIALWALDGVLIVLIAWLATGLAGLRGLMPAVLASIAGGSVALAATNLVLGTAAAGATGLVALLILLAWRDPAGIPAAARELRVTILATVLLMGAIVVAPLAAGVAVRGATDGSAIAAGTPGTAGAAALVGLLVLAVALGAGLRIGVIPFHLRIPQLTDAAPPIALPLLLAWVPLPLAVVSLAAVDLLVAPLALPLGGEQLVIVAVVIVTLVGASLAAILQDDIRHTTGYLVIADGAIVLLGLAALTPDAWGPARVWLVTLAATKTAVAAWAAVVESRFGSRQLPELRGWIRRSPILGAALLVAAVASFGFPGWVAYESRVALARLTGGPPLDAVLMALSFLTLPAYLRLLGMGTGRPTSRVDRAAPERIVRTRRTETLPVEADGTGAAATAATARPARVGPDTTANAAKRAAGRSRKRAARGATRTGRRIMRAVRRDATELAAAAVLTLAVLAALTSWGVLDIWGASSEPAPITTNASSD